MDLASTSPPGGCSDTSLCRLPALSADQSRHSMWRIGRPQTHLGGLLRWTGQAGPGRVISPAPMRTLTIVSASGPGPEWDVESDVGSTGPAPGRWLSDVPIVRGRACDHVLTLSLGTCKSHNGTQRNVTLLTSRINKRLSAANGSSSSRPK